MVSIKGLTLIYFLIRFIASCFKVRQNYDEKNQRTYFVTIFLLTVTLFAVSVKKKQTSVSFIKCHLKSLPFPKGYIEFSAIFHYHSFPVTDFGFYSYNIFQAEWQLNLSRAAQIVTKKKREPIRHLFLSSGVWKSLVGKYATMIHAKT